MKLLQLEKVQNISPEDFRQKYLLPQKPVVIKGLAAGTPAGKNWNLDYLKAICGDVTVDVYDNKNSNAATAYTRPDAKMKFSDYISSITGSQAVSLRMFLFNMFKSRPELRKDFPCPDMFKGILGRIGYMFFGARGINVRIHQDMDMSNVLLTQFDGRKRVVLFSPEYSKLLYKLPFNTHSLINVDAPDYKKYPGLQYVEGFQCVLEHGDSIFMPSGYWHYITYLDNGFGVSYRKMAIRVPDKLKGISNLLIYMPIDKLAHRLLGDKWLSKKEAMAWQRAERVIRKMQKEFPPIRPESQLPDGQAGRVRN